MLLVNLDNRRNRNRLLTLVLIVPTQTHVMFLAKIAFNQMVHIERFLLKFHWWKIRFCVCNLVTLRFTWAWLLVSVAYLWCLEWFTWVSTLLLSNICVNWTWLIVWRARFSKRLNPSSTSLSCWFTCRKRKEEWIFISQIAWVHVVSSVSTVSLRHSIMTTTILVEICLIFFFGQLSLVIQARTVHRELVCCILHWPL